MGATRGHRIRAAVSAGHVATHGVWTRTTENCRAPRHSLKEVLDEVARQTCRPRTHWCVIRRPVDINGLRYVEHIIGYRFGEFAPLHTISRCTAPLIPPSPSVAPISRRDSQPHSGESPRCAVQPKKPESAPVE